MALNSYDGLLASLAGWLMRDDLLAVLPDFISLAEDDMNKRLRLRLMMKRSTTTIDADLASDGYETLPGDFLQMWRLSLDGEPLEFAAASKMAEYAQQLRGGRPAYFSIVGEQLHFAPQGPAPGGLVEMVYYARVPGLSAANQTNALLLKGGPAIYLYGALKQSAPYLGDDPRIATWAQLYDEACGLLQGADDAAEFAGPLVPRVGMWG